MKLEFSKLTLALLSTTVLLAGCGGSSSNSNETAEEEVVIEYKDNLKYAYYSMANSVTGNDQIVAHNTETNEQTVINTNVILGSRALLFEGAYQNGKTTYTGYHSLLFLDPNQSSETRTAPDGKGGTFEYTFYSDNALMALDASDPKVERVLFNSGMLSDALKSAGVAVISSGFGLLDNVADPDNSYSKLYAFKELADRLQGEDSGAIPQVAVTVRLSDGASIAGAPVALLKNSNGSTNSLLVSAEAVHTDSSYPADDASRRHLQLCNAALTSCEAVTSSGGLGDGEFFYATENTTHIYLNKQGDTNFYAYSKTDGSLTQVSGVSYPAAFDSARHNVYASGHGGSGLISNFASITGTVTSLSEGENAYHAVNYDFDMQDPIGSYTYLGDIYFMKNGQVIKFTGTEGVKMFDTGDGVDQGDKSDGEVPGGNISLVTAQAGKVFIEIGNYNGVSAGGTCEPNASGYYCSSATYGYLNADTVNASVMDETIVDMQGLRYIVARRLTPYGINNMLYLNLLDKEGARGSAHQYTLRGYDVETVTEQTNIAGRSYLTMAAKYDDGRVEGTVLAWDGATAQLLNVTDGTTLTADISSTIPDSPAITSVFAQSSGLPLAGLGNVYALRADPGNHSWHLEAGQVTDEAEQVDYIDMIAGASWIYK